MKKIVLVFGSIAGVILSVMMLATVPFIDKIGFDRGEIFGYTSMVLAFLLIYFGVRSYRDNVLDGRISFGRAFKVGALIAAVASIWYVATWQVVYNKFTPDFMERYQAHVIDNARADGESEAQIAQRKADNEKYARWYKNPVLRAGMTFMEPLPVALIMALVSAGVLSRRRRDSVNVRGAVAT